MSPQPSLHVLTTLGCLSHVNVAFVRAPPPHPSSLLGNRQACWETKAKRFSGQEGGRKGGDVSHAGVGSSSTWGARKQAGGCVSVMVGGGVSSNCPPPPSPLLLVPHYEGRKGTAIFLQTDIKKITKHKSIWGQNYISLTQTLLSWVSSLSLSNCSVVSLCVCVRAHARMHARAQVWVCLFVCTGTCVHLSVSGA